MAPPRKPIHERLAANSKRVGECLIWTGAVHSDGYGSITIGRSSYRAHRISYVAAFGHPIPEGALVCHRCDTPLCIEPTHLFLGSPKDNTQDMIRKGRRRIVRDAEHPNTKIPHAERPTIRARRAAGEALASIAADYGVCFQTISQICKQEGCYGTA